MKFPVVIQWIVGIVEGKYIDRAPGLDRSIFVLDFFLEVSFYYINHDMIVALNVMGKDRFFIGRVGGRILLFLLFYYLSGRIGVGGGRIVVLRFIAADQ